MRQLFDADAPEQSERAEPALALDQILEPERLSLLQQQLALDDPLVGPHVADDEDVIDDRLLSLGDDELQVGAARRRVSAWARTTTAAGGEATIAIFEQHRLAVRHDRRLVDMARPSPS